MTYSVRFILLLYYALLLKRHGSFTKKYILYFIKFLINKQILCLDLVTVPTVIMTEVNLNQIYVMKISLIHPISRIVNEICMPRLTLCISKEMFIIILSILSKIYLTQSKSFSISFKIKFNFFFFFYITLQSFYVNIQFFNLPI
jgi:hypothetical protein